MKASEEQEDRLTGTVAVGIGRKGGGPMRKEEIEGCTLLKRNSNSLEKGPSPPQGALNLKAGTASCLSICP